MNGVVTHFVWDGMNMVYEYTDAESSSYIYGATGILYRKNSAGEVYTYTTSGRGDVVTVADSDGNAREYFYNAYGEIFRAFGSEPENPLLYCGEYYDAESGFIYLRNRYYEPSIGRFITEDPYWNVDNMIYGDDNGKVPSISAIMQSCNLYVYCGNNPILRIDPTGKTWEYFDMYLPQWAQNHLVRLTNNYYAAGDSRNEYGRFVRDDIHSEAVAFRMQFLDSKYLGQAVKDLRRVGLNISEPNYYQRVYEWAMALQESEKEAGPVPRNSNGDMNNYVFNALLGGVKADLKQFNDACRQLGINGDKKYDFQRYLEDYKNGRGMPAGQRLPYKKLLDIGKEFLGQ